MPYDLDLFLKEGEKDVTAADLMIEALFKLGIASFDELVRHSGKVEALAAVKPYRRWAAQILVDEAKKKLNIQSNGPDAMLMIHAFGGLITGSQPDNIEGEIKEKGVVGSFRDCPISGIGSQELCISISHFATEYEAEAINPEYEAVWTHHESSGDPYCRYVFKKKSDPISVLDDMGKTLAVLPKFEVPEAQLQAARLWAIAGLVWQNTSAFLHLHGEEKTSEVIGAVAIRIGQEMGARLAEQNLELKESVASTGKLVRAMQNALGQRDNFVVISENEVSNEITDCSQSDLYTQGCVWHEAFFNGMVSAINPDFEFSYDCTISKGDKNCHWTLRKEPGLCHVNDPLKVLKMRLAKGEINEEEYKRLKLLLEE